MWSDGVGNEEDTGIVMSKGWTIPDFHTQCCTTNLTESALAVDRLKDGGIAGSLRLKRKHPPNKTDLKVYKKEEEEYKTSERYNIPSEGTPFNCEKMSTSVADDTLWLV